jgi:hypothetical protein
MGDISKTSDVLLLANPYWRVRNGNMSWERISFRRSSVIELLPSGYVKSSHR